MMADKNNNAYPRHNGHVVIDQYPVQRLFLTGGDATVRLSIDCDKSPSGKADVYMHKKCCRRNGGKNDSEALFDVILIENEYTLKYDEIDYEAGRIYVRDLCKITPEQLYDAAMITKKRELANKNRPYTRDMINMEYVEAEKYPMSIDGIFK